MKKVFIALILALSFLTPVSANADTVEKKVAKIEADIKTASTIAKIAKVQAELALTRANQAEATSKKSVKDVEALRIKTMSELQAIKKQLNTLTKLLKTL